MKVAVFGAGTMGLGIAEVFASFDYDVLMYASSVASAQRHKKSMEEKLTDRVKRGKMTEEKRQAILSHVYVEEKDAAADADLVIETVKEDMAVKRELLLELDASDEQLDCPFVFASAKNGYATLNLAEEPKDMMPLFETIINYIPAPEGDPDANTQLLVSTIDYNEYVGRIAVGKVDMAYELTAADKGAGNTEVLQHHMENIHKQPYFMINTGIDVLCKLYHFLCGVIVVHLKAVDRLIVDIYPVFARILGALSQAVNNVFLCLSQVLSRLQQSLYTPQQDIAAEKSGQINELFERIHRFPADLRVRAGKAEAGLVVYGAGAQAG